MVRSGTGPDPPIRGTRGKGRSGVRIRDAGARRRTAGAQSGAGSELENRLYEKRLSADEASARTFRYRWCGGSPVAIRS